MKTKKCLLGLYSTNHLQTLAVIAMKLSPGQSSIFSVKSGSSSIYNEDELESSTSTTDTLLCSQAQMWSDSSGASEGDVQVLLDISATQYQQAFRTLNSDGNRYSSKLKSIRIVTDYCLEAREGAEGPPRCCTPESRQLSCDTEHNITLGTPRTYL